jgi:hypothetical protein
VVTFLVCGALAAVAETLAALPPVSAALPFVVKARRLSKEASRALLLVAVFAIVNPITS